MLRIQQIDLSDSLMTLALQGSIAAEWADLLERQCLAASRAGTRLALDLSGVVYISRSGFEVLMRLSRAGIVIVGCPPLLADPFEQEGIGENGFV